MSIDPNTWCPSVDVACISDLYTGELDFLSLFSFEILAPISAILSLLLIITHIAHKKLRQSPGDIILGLSCSDFLLALHWIILFRDPDWRMGCPCYLLGIIGVWAGFANFLYNLSFIFYIYQKVKHVLKQGKIMDTKKFHYIVLIGSTVGTLYLMTDNGIGQNVFGTCSKRFNCEGDMKSGTITLAVYLLYSAFAYYIYNFLEEKTDPQEAKTSESGAFIYNYQLYLMITCILWAIVAIAMSYNEFATHQPGEEWGMMYYLFVPLGNLFKGLQSVILISYRYRESFVRRGVTKVFYSFKNRFFATEESKLKEALLEKQEDDELGGYAGGDMQLVVYSSASHRRSSGEKLMVDQFTIEKEFDLTCTILSALLVCAIKHGDSEIDVYDLEDQVLERASHAVQTKIISKLLPGTEAELREVRGKIVKSQIEVVAHEVFSDIRKWSRAPVNFLDSFSIGKNKEQLKKAKNNSGGKSGEFFYFTQDDDLIIKSISQKEFDTLLSILPSYYQHLKNHPDSLIVRIVGLYVFRYDQDPMPIIVMQNLCSLPKKYVVRKFDMKGSKYDREVLSKYPKIDERKIRSLVLKDTDFTKLEQTLKISESAAQKLIEVIDSDAEFLCSNNLMDYSFLACIANRGRYFEDHNLALPDDPAIPTVDILPSFEKEGLFYYFGIIDFLQTYDLTKMMEKNMKKIANTDTELDTSSQDAQTYRDRFKHMIRGIIPKEFPKPTEENTAKDSPQKAEENNAHENA